MSRIDKDLLKKIGDNIRAYRKLIGISQQELALRAELTHVQISRIEAGKVNVTISTLSFLATELNITISHILD